MLCKHVSMRWRMTTLKKQEHLGWRVMMKNMLLKARQTREEAHGSEKGKQKAGKIASGTTDQKCSVHFWKRRTLKTK